MDGCVVCVALTILWIVIKCCYVEYLKLLLFIEIMQYILNIKRKINEKHTFIKYFS